ncbi:MAG: aquaporin [Armatimonadota bacterium]|nr:aquaporin [Armatimonadota bacterium]MDR7519960.1 aquaporin [Armatimonadota bacterium]MDR7548591.1 aquaporin [Armatimonadota bacterium]
MSQPVWKALVAELVGTFTLVFIGAGAILADALTDGKVGPVGIALAHAVALATMVSATGHLSGGHINPAVTAAFVATGRMVPGTGAAYVLAQLVGASLGAFFLTASFPEAVRQAAVLGTPVLAEGASAGTGIVVEALLTFFLVFVVFGTAVDERGPRAAGGLFIGLVLAMDILAGAPLTGAAMNPARAFGPALFAGVWTNHVVYWVGPLIGGVVAGWVYHSVFRPS